MRIQISALAALAVPSLASAGELTSMSDAIVDGYQTVLEVEALETHCKTFAVDEEANLLSRYITLMAIEEVYLGSGDDDSPAEDVVVGESMEVEWYQWTDSPFLEDENMGCSTPAFSISVGAHRPIAVDWSDESWSVDPWYYDDFETSTTGAGDLPPCGEAEQQVLIDEIREARGDTEGDPDTPDDGDPESQDDLDSDPQDTEDEEDAPAGCSAVSGAALGPVLALVGLVGIGRRRRR